MKGTKFALVSLIWISVSLSQPAFADQQQGCLRLKQSWADYDALRKGDSLAVQFKFKSHHCHLTLDLRPMSFTAETQPGITVILYDHGYEKIKKSDKVPMGRAADELTFTVVIKADDDVASGTYEIPAVLSYQAIDASGGLVEQSNTLKLGVKIVPKGTKVRHQEEPSALRPLKVASGIVLTPVVIVLSAVGVIPGPLPD